MISNANKNKITNTALPNMSQTIIGWFQPITFVKISRTIVDYEQVLAETKIDTAGVVQIYKPEPLEIQQFGTRSWVWQDMHCLPDVILNTDDIIIYKNTRYKVLFKKDYKEYGYVEYMLCEAFDGGANGVA